MHTFTFDSVYDVPSPSRAHKPGHVGSEFNRFTSFSSLCVATHYPHLFTSRTLALPRPASTNIYLNIPLMLRRISYSCNEVIYISHRLLLRRHMDTYLGYPLFVSSVDTHADWVRTVRRSPVTAPRTIASLSFPPPLNENWMCT